MSAGGNQEQSTADGTPRSVLAVARAAQNLSVADVARQLKLSERQVEALEAGAFDKLPGPVFVRGFIRNYARLLKLEPDRVFASLNLDPAAQPERHEMPRSPEIPFPPPDRRRWPKYAVAAGLAIAGLAAYELYREQPPAPTMTRESPSSQAVAVAPRPAPDVVPVTVNAPEAPGAAKSEDTSGQPAAQPASGTPESAPVSPAQTDARRGAEEGELHFIFGMESWVEVRDADGRIMLTRLNPRGSEQRIKGKPPFRLIVGNARGVQLTYNGRPVDLERHIKVSVAHLTVE
jgi:cytoskeleton protein RodZ